MLSQNKQTAFWCSCFNVQCVKACVIRHITLYGDMSVLSVKLVELSLRVQKNQWMQVWIIQKKKYQNKKIHIAGGEKQYFKAL